MISNSLGAMPRGVDDSLHHYTDLWATRGVRAWEEQWWMMAREVGDAIGSLLNAARLGRVHLECHHLPDTVAVALTSAAAATRSFIAI